MRPGLVAALLVTAALARAVPIAEDELWASFKRHYKKHYDNDVEEDFRRSVFYTNQRKIALHNEAYNMGLYTYTIKMNQFGDMLFEEYKNYMHAVDKSNIMQRRVVRGEEFVMQKNDSEVSDAIDWRKEGAVTPVRDQGLTCGSCWAFSATGALEGQFFKKTGLLLPLSAQKLIDCTGDYGNMGCGGGNAAVSFQFVKDNNGLDSEASYAYEGRTGNCPQNSTEEDSEGVNATFVYINYADEAALKIAVATIGPISAAIDGSHDSFRFYSEGIYYQRECNEEDLNHAVLIVGYGTDSATAFDYWLVKNSWGETWGEAGYFKIARNRSNHCGIAAAAIYPVV